MVSVVAYSLLSQKSKGPNTGADTQHFGHISLTKTSHMATLNIEGWVRESVPRSRERDIGECWSRLLQWDPRAPEARAERGARCLAGLLHVNQSSVTGLPHAAARCQRRRRLAMGRLAPPWVPAQDPYFQWYFVSSASK